MLSVEAVEGYIKFMTFNMKTLNEDQKKAVMEHYLTKMKAIFANKKGLMMPAELYVLRKK